ncbi:hypothetical protein ACFQ1S_30420 [Kibdelosporangium lantanae]|uniref:Alpha/beta hydrolase n=1 Tax=Kibdelosporangium lantanae TaxID=1497396 RepID=A0ABW3MJX2_9PSEU
MDILSDVVTVMRTGRPVSARVEWHAPWTQRFAEVPDAPHMMSLECPTRVARVLSDFIQ